MKRKKPEVLTSSSEEKLKRKRLLIHGLVIAGSFSLAYVLSVLCAGLFARVEPVACDSLFRLRYSVSGKLPVSPYLVHVVFDDSSLSSLDTAFPEREVYGRIIGILEDLDADKIVCDVFFQEIPETSFDRTLAKAIADAGNVYLPMVLFDKTKEPANRNDAAIRRHVWHPKILRAGSPPEAGSVMIPASGSFAESAGTGHINCDPDPDGINRKFPLLYSYNEGFISALPLSAACDFLKADRGSIEVAFGRFIKLKNASLPGSPRKDIVIPIDNNGRVALNYVSPHRSSFYTISAKDLLNAEKDRGLKQKLRDVLEGSLVFVSDTSVRNKDVGPGVFDRLIPYSEILITVANMALTGEFIVPLSRIDALLASLLLILPLYLASFFRNLAVRLGVTAGFFVLFIFVCIGLFFFAKLLLPFLVTATGFFVYFVGLCILTCYEVNYEASKYREKVAILKDIGMPIDLLSETPSIPKIFAAVSNTSNKGSSGDYEDLMAEPVEETRDTDKRKILKYHEVFENIITKNERMIGIFKDIEDLRGSTAPILIIGETGTGKELIAMAIHKVSGSTGEYITVNIAGVDDQFFSDTLFGHKRGAYTGAEKDERGFVEIARDGTLFLDEIGDLNLVSQVKLLRLIENKEYYPLGSKVPMTANVRIIAATNANIEDRLKTGAFREDLSQRLGLRLHIPPLRNRKEDIGILIAYFIERSAKKMNKTTVPRYNMELIRLLKEYEFPGNIRELESMVDEAVSKNESKTLPITVFKERINRSRYIIETAVYGRDGSKKAFHLKGNLAGLLDDIEKYFIDDAMNKTMGNRKRAAELLGVQYDWLKRRVKEGLSDRAKT